MKKKPDIGYILHFYWFYILGGLALLAAIIGILFTLLTKEPEPDYTVALMSAEMIEEPVLERLRQRFESAAEDLNGDGKTWVEITAYTYAAAQSEEEANKLDPYEAVAGTIWFQAEILMGKSAIYIVSPYTYETLAAQDPTFFVPAADIIASAEGETIAMSAITDDELWQKFEIALHMPADQTAAEQSFSLIERILEGYRR